MEKPFIAVKKKALLAFLISTLALFAIYYIYQIALQNIRLSVEELAQPNNKLSAVNELYFEINKSEKSFRELVLSESKQSLNDFIQEADMIQKKADSLGKICANNAYQITLMDSIQSFILKRNKLLLNYLNYQKKLQKNNPITKQMAQLNRLVEEEQKIEKALIRSKEEQKITYKIDTLSINQDKQSFWDKLFNRNKNVELKIGSTKKETVQSKVDTVVLQTSNEQQIALQKMLQNLSNIQQQSLQKYQHKELEILQFEKQFTLKITQLLAAIENEFLWQTQANKTKAEQTINQSISKINMLIFTFILATLLVLVLTYFDLHKIDKLSSLLAKASAKANFETQAKQRFLSHMSHEIRTPLQSIIGYTEQLFKSPNNSQEYVQIIHQSSEHLLQVVNEILDYSRIHAGKFTFDTATFWLNQTLKEVTDIVHYQAKEKGLLLEISLPQEPIPPILGDPFRLKQILLNLLSNAIKFTEKGKVSLYVKTEIIAQNLACQIQVCDTGIGIQEDRMQSIFEAFEQAIPENAYHGTGLGLSITKALIEEQGGSIKVSSKIKQGSTFEVNLQYPIAANTESKTSLAPTPILPLQGEVWLVDDDPFIRQLCLLIFQNHHIKHRCFGSAQDLIEAAWLSKPNLVFIDIRMPHMNGFELYQKLLTIWAEPTIMLALTAQALPPERSAILNHGFKDILSKPFKEQALLNALQQYLLPKEQKLAHNLREIDTTNFRKMLGNNLDLVSEMVTQFKLETKQDLNKIESHIANNEWSELSLYFHRMAGRFGQLGAHQLAQELRKVELRLDKPEAEINLIKTKELLAQTAQINEQLLDIVLFHFGVQSTSVDV